MEPNSVAFGVLFDKLNELAKRGKRRTDALKWIKSNDEQYGSFFWCCMQTGLDYEKARDHVYKQSRHTVKNILNNFVAEMQEAFPNAEVSCAEVIDVVS